MVDTTFKARSAAAVPTDFAAVDKGAAGLVPYKAVADGDDVAQGARADAAWTGTGSASVVSVLKGIFARLLGLTQSTYSDITVASLTAGQAAGTDPIIAASSSRKSLMINPPSDCTLVLPGGTTGWPIFAGVPNTISGVECPTNALHVLGLAAGQTVTVWQGS